MATIAEFAGHDAKLYALAEVARVVEEATGKVLKDPAAWLRRRKISTVTRVWRSARYGTVRLTLAQPADVIAGLSAKRVTKTTEKVDNVAPMRQTKSNRNTTTAIRRKAA
jgi:hypothetical protein